METDGLQFHCITFLTFSFPKLFHQRHAGPGPEGIIEILIAMRNNIFNKKLMTYTFSFEFKNEYITPFVANAHCKLVHE